MATIKNEFDYIQEARSQLAEALVNKFGVREQDILNADGSIKSTGLWASNSDGSKNYLKRLHDWAVLVTATNVHTDASLTFKNDGSGDAADTTFNGSVARSISYNSIGAAPVGHTHTTKIETSTNTSLITLAYGGKYKLTAGGTTYVFTMPSSDNTWRPIGTGANDAAAGNHAHKNLIIKWGTGNTEGTNLFTYNGSTAKTIDLSTPFSLLFTNFDNTDTGFKSTDITAIIGGTTKSFTVNWAAYTGRAQTADRWTTARTLTIGSTGKSVNGSENVSWTLAEIGAADSSHTHRVVINDTSKLITASPTAVNLGSYLPLEGGTMTGAINLSSPNARIAFGNLNTSPISGYMAPALTSEGVGIYSRLWSTVNEGAIIITEDTCVIYNSAEAGWNFQVMNIDLGTDMSLDGTRSFGVNNDYQAWSLGGFVKYGSSDNYVLLGGGGHKAISDFAMSGHTHSYLPLAGGTMTGPIITPGDDSAVLKPARNGYDQIGDKDRKFWKIYSSYFYGNFVGTADNANALGTATKSKFVYANGDFGTSDVTNSDSLDRTQFWRDNNRGRIGVFVSHHSNSIYGWEISAPYSKNGDFTGRIKENGIWGTEYTFLTDSNFKLIINNTSLREFWINGYNGTETSTNCPVLVMHWPDIKYLDIWLDSTGFHFGEHASYNNGADLHAKNYYADSDIRYKNVIKHSCIDLSSLATLPLFLYTWNDKQDDTIHIGSSAQAVELVIPLLVTEDSTGFKSLDYSILGTVAGITACKELVSQKSEIEMLKERVKLLELQLKMYNG